MFETMMVFQFENINKSNDEVVLSQKLKKKKQKLNRILTIYVVVNVKWKPNDHND